MAPESSTIKIFVNDHVVVVDRTATVREAVERVDPTLTDPLARGKAYITDGVGRRLDDTRQVAPGGIYRVVVSARQHDDWPATA